MEKLEFTKISIYDNKGNKMATFWEDANVDYDIKKAPDGMLLYVELSVNKIHVGTINCIDGKVIKEQMFYDYQLEKLVNKEG